MHAVFAKDEVVGASEGVERWAGRVIVHDIQNDLDLCAVQLPHHELELVQRCTALDSVPPHRSKEALASVAPVVVERLECDGVHLAAVGLVKLEHGQQLHRRHSERHQVRYLFNYAEEGAAVVRIAEAARAVYGKAAHVHLVDDQLAHGAPRRRYALPVECRVGWHRVAPRHNVRMHAHSRRSNEALLAPRRSCRAVDQPRVRVEDGVMERVHPIRIQQLLAGGHHDIVQLYTPREAAGVAVLWGAVQPWVEREGVVRPRMGDEGSGGGGEQLLGVHVTSLLGIHEVQQQ
mmetsp:Transcript_18915/g.32558  ORF Transcript_18915/g.32558 Transcript_18915/m.32558 type:complete len:290 (+) Transcript_18915:1518-2387(+)